MFTPKIKTNAFNSNIKAKNVIIHFIPEFGTTILDHLDHISMQMVNVRDIFIRDSIFKVGPVRINPKAYYAKLKSDIKKTDYSYMRVLKSLPSKIPESSVTIVDYSKTVEGLEKLRGKISDRVLLFYLFEQIKKEVEDITHSRVKSKSGSVKQAVMISVMNPGDDGLLNMLSFLRKLDKKELQLSYSTFGDIVLVNSVSEHSAILPILGYEKSKVTVYSSSFSKIKNRLPAPTKNELVIKNNDVGKSSAAKPIAAAATSIVDNGEDFVADTAQISRILKRVNIKNRNVESAVSSFVSAKIKNAAAEKRVVSKQDLEKEVVKAINYSLTAKSNVDIEPVEVIQQLANSEIQSVNMKLPLIETNSAVSPLSAVDIDRVSGVNRQEFEFTENINEVVATLFKSLTSKKSNPIAIKKIKVINNNDSLNTYKTFEVTLQNTSGGDSKPYTVSINIPSIVNDSYFRLNGKDYIIATQQYLKPIVKDKPSDIRFLTHYNMTRMNIVNIRHNITDYIEIIKLIEDKYPDLIDDIAKKGNSIEYVKFSNGTEIWPDSSSVFVNDDSKKISQSGSKTEAEYSDGSVVEMQGSKTEVLFETVFSILTDKHPKEASKTSTAPYLQVYTVGLKLPFIILLWQQVGLLDALLRINVDYKISADKPDGATVSVPLSDGTSIWMIPSTYRQELIVNGLLAFQRNNKFQLDAKTLNDRNSISVPLRSKFGNRSFDKLDSAAELMIDPTTEQLLKDEGHPTNYIDVIAGPMIDKLFNEPPSHPNDLATMRARQAEIMSELIYNELGMAYNRYKDNVGMGDKNAKIFLDQNYIIDNLTGKHPNSKFKGGAVIEYTDLYNPVSELIETSRVIRTGKGGIPNTRAFRKEQRVLHDSHLGNISAHATPEYANVGIVNHHCLGAQISGGTGIYGGKVDDTDTNPWSSVAINEALVPFQNQMHSDRLIMATTHMSQKVPIVDGEIPLVGTGAEAIVAQLASSKFIHRANMDGKVIDVDTKMNTLTVQYKNGKTEVFDIANRKALISGNSNILISMTSLKKGDKFKANEAVTWSSSFKDNELAVGRNMRIAVMSRMGKNFEDGYAISKKAAETTRTEKMHRIPIMIDPNTEVYDFLTEIGTETTSKDTLFSFKYVNSVDDYLQQHDMTDLYNDSDADIHELGDNTIRTSSVGGRLIDVKITLNTTKNMDVRILNAWKKQNSLIKSKLKALESSAINDKEKHSDNVDRSVTIVGKHKFKGKMFEGALIEFFLVEEKGLVIGDKIAGRFGTKGVVTDIVQETSKAEYTEEIDLFISPLSILGRKNTAVVKELYIGKILYNLPKILAKAAKVKPAPKLRAMIMQVYKIMDTTKKKSNISSITDKLKALSDTQLKTALVNQDIRFNILYPPFTNISFKQIKSAATALNIPLDEKVYIPELKMWTKERVPVGINYISPMEQMSDDKESTRSVAGYKQLTGQPTKGKADMGGQSIGGLDTFAMLSYDAEDVLHELMTARSDNRKAKSKMINDLRSTGNSSLAELPQSQGQTRKNLNIFMLSMGLEI